MAKPIDPERQEALRYLASLLKKGPEDKAKMLGPALRDLGVPEHCVECDVTGILAGIRDRDPRRWNGHRAELYDRAKVTLSANGQHLCSPSICPVIRAIDAAFEGPGWLPISFSPRVPAKKSRGDKRSGLGRPLNGAVSPTADMSVSAH